MFRMIVCSTVAHVLLFVLIVALTLLPNPHRTEKRKVVSIQVVAVEHRPEALAPTPPPTPAVTPKRTARSDPPPNLANEAKKKKLTPKPKPKTPKPTPKPKTKSPTPKPKTPKPKTRTPRPKTPRPTALVTPLQTRLPTKTPAPTRRQTAAPTPIKPVAIESENRDEALPSFYAKHALDAIQRKFTAARYQRSNVKCKVSFTVQENGTITDPKIEKSTGNSHLDNLALQALERTKALSPLPDIIRMQGKTSIRLLVTFDFSLK